MIGERTDANSFKFNLKNGTFYLKKTNTTMLAILSL